MLNLKPFLGKIWKTNDPKSFPVTFKNNVRKLKYVYIEFRIIKKTQKNCYLKLTEYERKIKSLNIFLKNKLNLLYFKLVSS